MRLLASSWCGSGLMSRLFEAVFDGDDLAIASGEWRCLNSKAISFDGAYKLVCLVTITEGSHRLVGYEYAVVHGFPLSLNSVGFPQLCRALRVCCRGSLAEKACDVGGLSAVAVSCAMPAGGQVLVGGEVWFRGARFGWGLPM